jgi:hypothetical protein
MKKKLVLVVCIFICIRTTFAQDSLKTKSYKYNNYFDLAISGKKEQFAIAASWSHLHGIGKGKKRFKIGYGTRFTSYFGTNRYYTTAPAEYINPVQNLETIATEPIDENIDTIAIASPQVNLFNLTINLQYTIKKRLDIGFNIDAIGFSFGSQKKAYVISSSYDSGQKSEVYASPTAFNLLLTSNNDLGSLNSEFYLRYWVTPKLAIKGGFTFLFTEYTTDTELSFNNGTIVNDRYRFKSGLAMMAISWRPFVK